MKKLIIPGLVVLGLVICLGDAQPQVGGDKKPKKKPPAFGEGPKINLADLKGPQIVIKEPIRLAAGEPPFKLSGAAMHDVLGDPHKENAGKGIRFPSQKDSGAVSITVNLGEPARARRSYRFRIRGMAQPGFRVEKDELFVRIEFFKDGGKNSLDSIKKSIYDQVERDRKDLLDMAINKNLDGSSWRQHVFIFRTPFAEVDTLRLTAGFANGAAKGPQSEFWIDEIEIVRMPDPPEKVATGEPAPRPDVKSLVPLGGRWYFDPRGGSKQPPKQFDHTNADTLCYLTDRLETPFAGTTTAWLKRGYLDREDKMVEADVFAPDNVIVSFTDKHLVIKSRNLPNHPTATFPDRWRAIDGNPNFIKEQINTWYIPLDPKVNPNHIAMDAKNSNNAIPLGPCAVAVNGITFLNPFDDTNDHDALWRLDRCCGHPSPGQRYHYHKYPVCLNTPWADDGKAHSPLIGFAFDGFPIYGPYEDGGELAKDSKKNPLNEFNLHEDPHRGPHYHVTPGKFPHVLGGFWGVVEPMNNVGKKGPKKK